MRWARVALVLCSVPPQRLVVVGAAATWRIQGRRVVPVALAAAVQALQTQQTLVVQQHLPVKETTVVPELLRVDRTLAAVVVVLAVLAVTVGRAVAVRAVRAHQTTSRGRL